MLPVAVARSSYDDNAICYVLPDLWMMSCFHMIGQIQIQAWSLRRSELFTVTRQVAPLNCAPGAKSAIADCLAIIIVISTLTVRDVILGTAQRNLGGKPVPRRTFCDSQPSLNVRVSGDTMLRTWTCPPQRVKWIAHWQRIAVRETGKRVVAVVIGAVFFCVWDDRDELQADITASLVHGRLCVTKLATA